MNGAVTKVIAPPLGQTLLLSQAQVAGPGLGWGVSTTHHHVDGDHAALGIHVQHAPCQGPAVARCPAAHEALVLGSLEKP